MFSNLKRIFLLHFYIKFDTILADWHYDEIHPQLINLRTSTRMVSELYGIPSRTHDFQVVSERVNERPFRGLHYAFSTCFGRAHSAGYEVSKTGVLRLI